MCECTSQWEKIASEVCPPKSTPKGQRVSFSGSQETTQDDSEEVKTVTSKIDEALCKQIYKICTDVSSNTLTLLSNAIILKHSEICLNIVRSSLNIQTKWKDKLLPCVIQWIPFNESCVLNFAGLYEKRTANHNDGLWLFIE